MFKKMVIERPVSGKFVALYADGSGSKLFCLCEGGQLLDAEGDFHDIEDLEDFSHWAALPEDYKMWFEFKQDEEPTND